MDGSTMTDPATRLAAIRERLAVYREQIDRPEYHGHGANWLSPDQVRRMLGHLAKDLETLATLLEETRT